MALRPDQHPPPAATGSDGGGGGGGAGGPAEDADGCRESGLDPQQQPDDRVQTHRRRMADEGDAFAELAAMLPLRRPVKGFTDKLNVLRLAIAFLKISRFYRRGLAQSARPQGWQQWETPERLTDALSGFVFILDGNGWILYVSSSVSRHLGHCAADMVGANIRSYLHAEDAAELAAALRAPVRGAAARGAPCRLLLRATSALRAGRGRGRHRALLCCGYRRLCQLTARPLAEHNRAANILLVAAAHALPHSYLPACEAEPGARTSLTVLGRSSFVFRAGLDLTPFFVEAAVRDLTEYDSFTFSHYSLYHFVHPSDVETVGRSHKDVLAKGHAVTGYYRLFVRSGGWVWMQSYFTVVHAARAARNKFILSVNYAVSGVEHSSSDAHYPNQLLPPRYKSGALGRSKGKGLSCCEGKCLATSTPYINPDQNAAIASSVSPQANGHKTALGYSCVLANLMKSLAARESAKKEENHKYWSQSQPEADEMNNNNNGADSVSINAAGLSGGTVHQNLPLTPQKAARPDSSREFSRQLSLLASPKDGRPQHVRQQPLKSLILKFVSEATPFTDEDSNLVSDTSVLDGSDRFQYGADFLTPVQKNSAVMDNYQPSQCRSCIEPPRLPARGDPNQCQVPELCSLRGNTRMDRGSALALPSCQNAPLLPSVMKHPFQAQDVPSGSTTKRTDDVSSLRAVHKMGFNPTAPQFY